MRGVRIGAVERLLEVNQIDTAREAIDVRMSLAFGAIKTGTAGKDEISEFQQGIFPLKHLFWRIFESGKFIHAVVNHEGRIQLLQQRESHGRIEPGYMLFIDIDRLPYQFDQMGQLLIMKA